MEEVTLYLNNEHSVGLGDNLCLLSGLANLPVNVVLHVSNKHNTFDKLTHYKQLFKIPSQLTIVKSDDDYVGTGFNNHGWPSKLLVDYYKPNSVTIGKQTIRTSIDKREKRFIGIVCSIESEENINSGKWPYCRARPIAYWQRVFAWAKQEGYDIITLDYAFNNLEDKIKVMLEHCKAIIGYEGGMAHLAHMLRIPYFMVNWKLPSSDTILGRFHCEFVHRTNTVYIMHHDEELFSWGTGDFEEKISQLNNGLTNNRLANGQTYLQFAGPGIYGKASLVDTTSRQVLLNLDTPFYRDTSSLGMLLNQVFGAYDMKDVWRCR